MRAAAESEGGEARELPVNCREPLTGPGDAHAARCSERCILLVGTHGGRVSRSENRPSRAYDMAAVI